MSNKTDALIDDNECFIGAHVAENLRAAIAGIEAERDALRTRIIEIETQLQPKPAESPEWQYCPTCGFLRHTGNATP